MSSIFDAPISRADRKHLLMVFLLSSLIPMQVPFVQIRTWETPGHTYMSVFSVLFPKCEKFIQHRL